MLGPIILHPSSSKITTEIAYTYKASTAVSKHLRLNFYYLWKYVFGWKPDTYFKNQTFIVLQDQHSVHSKQLAMWFRPPQGINY